MLSALRAITDPRRRRGVRHQLVVVLAVAVCAVMAGARSYVAIAEWAHDLPVGLRRRLGICRVPPSESAIRRVLQLVDPHLLDRTVCGWLAARRTQDGPRWQAIAVDGKAVRGARRADGRAVHLLAALEHADAVVRGQRVVDGKTNEITEFAPLLDGIDITDVIVTADALHTQREHAGYLHRRGAHYLFTVKGNQPKLHAQLRALPWTEVPASDLTRDKSHGRAESRTMKLTAVTAGIGFPHAVTAIQIVRRRRPLNGHKWKTETVFAITDLDQSQIRPDELADILRGHWRIENRLHWVRDVTFAEDHSQIRTGHGPAVMAVLRNLAISVHRRHGSTNIASATRRIARHPGLVLPLLHHTMINAG
ncbi:MAG: ISAs1 family transposase [Rhodanobacteraceae bacterium]|nr:MAG: ISAs1 family transposase [Rhodanobacteraceae bacterium]